MKEFLICFRRSAEIPGGGDAMRVTARTQILKNVIACAKHFVGDGGTDKGKNEGNTICTFEELEATHMKPYLDCLAQGVSTIMASYSSWNGRPLHSEYYLITEILKKKLGFKVPIYEKVLEDLVFLVESGRISMSRIDDAVERILRVKFVVGLFEYPFSDRSLFDVVGCKVPSGTTVLEAIREAAGNETEVVHERCPSEATFSDQEYSYAIVAIGEDAYAEFLGDRTELGIPFDGATMISLVAGQVPTVVIVISGRPLVLEPELLDKIDALVAAWLPGSEGGGVADVLFGDYDFEGVLPVTWFKSADQLPMNAGHNAYDPLFPLGYGLKMNLDSRS
ncbi:hypothetical protein GW17_00012062 [Ensete ventricosum]|nr:hypothetical protein GW17_00012062 [Ensete ventricosum]